MTDFRCADDAFARDEPMFATASRVERWMLVEQSGPFTAEPIPAGRISPPALTRLSQQAARARARLVLIRRPPRIDREPGLRVFYADARPGHERLVSRLLADELALCELSLDDAGWTPVTRTLFLVCTHGRHDPCCALRGRPVVAAVADTLASGRVWECSHIGGDRFAGNIVALPAGLYLGRVEAEEAPAVVELIDSGRVPVHYLRGRSALSALAQAAQHFARTAGGFGSFDAVGDLLPLETARSRDDGPAAWTILLACPAGEVSVTVRRTISAQPAQLTCHVAERKFYPQFELVRIRQLTGG
jgi:hypothetical protein